jgi:hypothetical protein
MQPPQKPRKNYNINILVYCDAFVNAHHSWATIFYLETSILMGSVLTGLLRRFLSAFGTYPVDHKSHFNHVIVGWQSGHRHTTFG